MTVKEDGRIVKAGFAFPTSGGNMVEYDMLAFSNGGRFADEVGNPTLNTQENKEALEYIASFIDDVSIPYNNNETNPFMVGNAAMTFIDNVKLAPMFEEPEYKDKIAIAMPPASEGSESMTFSGCRLLYIGKDCKNTDAAFDFISYALSSDVVFKRAQELDVPVVLNSLFEDYAGMNDYNDVRAECVANGIDMPITTWSTPFQTIRNDLLQEVLKNFCCSFTNYNLGGKADFVGFSNYREVFADYWFLEALKNTAVYAVFSVIFLTALGLFISILLNSGTKLVKAARTVMIFPYATSMVAVSMIWLYLLDPTIGYVNKLLIYMGINNPPY